MAEKQPCDVDFSDSDFLVSQMGRKARVSKLKKQPGTPETSAPEEISGLGEERRAFSWRPLVGRLLVLIPLALLAWYWFSSR